MRGGGGARTARTRTPGSWTGTARARPRPPSMAAAGRSGRQPPIRRAATSATMPADSRSGWDTVASSLLRLEAGLAVSTAIDLSFRGEANFLEPRTRRQEVSVDVSAVSAMLSAYLDLPGLGMLRVSARSAPLSAAASESRAVATDETHMEFPEDPDHRAGRAPDRVRVDHWRPGVGDVLRANGRLLELAWRYTECRHRGDRSRRRAASSGAMRAATRYRSISGGDRRADLADATGCTSCPALRLLRHPSGAGPVRLRPAGGRPPRGGTVARARQSSGRSASLVTCSGGQLGEVEVAGPIAPEPVGPVDRAAAPAGERAPRGRAC